jgi:hypothetical protein
MTGNKRGKKWQEVSYHCEYPPCIHVVVDERKRIFKVFVEHEYGDDTMVVSIPTEKLEKACRILSKVTREGLREASDLEIDDLARKYLNVTPYEEEE